jgi:gamma-glutamylcyclotransferase (GGCT)/AIG2-like uncharacterized protein YtfP
MKPIAVYGTLIKGFHNSRLWDGLATYEECIIHDFRLVTHGWYPYAIPDEGSITVGQIITPTSAVNASTILSRLDYLEGVPDHYSRESTTVELEDGAIVTAWIYVPVSDESSLDPVPENNWRLYASLV